MSRSQRFGRRRGRRSSSVSDWGRLGALATILVAWYLTRQPAVLVMFGFLVLGVVVLTAVIYWFFRRQTRLRVADTSRLPADPELSDAAIRLIPTDSRAIADALREQELRYAPPSARTPNPPSQLPLTRTSPTTLHTAHPEQRTLAEKLAAIDWFQFERLMARAYEKQGHTVERRGGAHADDGIDLVIHRNGEAVGVQCKHWKAWKVNPKTVREMLGAITAAKLRSGIILCWCGFTQEGHAKAAEYGITLVDAPGILQILESVDARFDPEMQALLDDQRKFCPRCESPMLLRTASKGTQAGESFWGCSRFPRCSHTLPVQISP